jgi:hypothetical protein
MVAVIYKKIKKNYMIKKIHHHLGWLSNAMEPFIIARIHEEEVIMKKEIYYAQKNAVGHRDAVRLYNVTGY